jgi:hypothetical protein
MPRRDGEVFLLGTAIALNSLKKKGSGTGGRTGFSDLKGLIEEGAK